MSHKSVSSTGSASKQVCTNCGNPFLSKEARVCAKCGKPRPRKKPEGPPCAYCKAPLMKHGVKVCGACGRSQPPPSSEKPNVGPSGDRNTSSLTPTQTMYPPNSELVVSSSKQLPKVNKTPGVQGTLKNQYPSALQQSNNNEQVSDHQTVYLLEYKYKHAEPA